MRILVIAPQPFFAERGTPIAVRRLVETLCADGHEVDLLTYPFGTDVEVEGLSIHRARTFPGVDAVGIGFSLRKLLLDLMLLPKFFQMAKSGRYHTVHAVEEAVYLALLLRRRHQAKVVYDMDSSLVDQLADSNTVFRLFRPLLTRIEQWAIRHADVVAPMCQDLADYAVDIRETEDAVVLHDVPVETASVASALPLTMNGANEGRPLALYVGNLEAYQGIDLLVEAAGLLPRESPVSIQVVGGPMNEVERFRSLIAERDLRDRIQFLGPRPLEQLNERLARADILLSPRSKGGNTPLKVYSYMESGRAILATRLSTHTQVLDDSTALLVDPSPEAYARGLARLAGDEELRNTLGESAQRRVRRSYSPRSFARKVRDIYGSHRPRAAHAGSAWGLSDVWHGADRRASGERRRGGDRRSGPRAGRERRVGERRSLIHA
ncbi:MAG: glycosyltransferase [Gemmatimonadetes bacterium]|nr:glycosyltransferase [Gemmatimonadota bacterium]